MAKVAKRVAIVGAGPAGIVALKTVKEYGHHVTCFEKEASFGGLWNIGESKKNIAYEKLENMKYGISSGYNSLLMNTCTSMSEFSDFPISKTLDFLLHNEYLEYLGQYIAHFDLQMWMKFNSTVTKLEKNGKEWLVKYTIVDGGLAHEQQMCFDFVIVATGTFRFPLFSDVKGLDSFPGLVVHSGQVRNESLLFKDKHVLVVGTGNSGLELTSAALKFGAQKVSLSVTETDERRNQFIGKHFLPDPRQNGRLVPYDAYGICWHARDRGAEAAQEFFSLWTIPVKKSLASNYIIQFPKDGTVCTQVDLIDDMTSRGIYEKVGGIANIRGTNIHLDDNSTLNNVDIIVFATGFKCKFPMLNEIWPVDEQEKCELNWHIVPTAPTMDGLVFLDTTNTISASLMPVMEMQARYTCEQILCRDYTVGGELFTDADREQMKKDIEEEKLGNLTFDRAFNHMVDAPGYILKLAKVIGCDPPDYKFLLQSGAKEAVEFGVALYYGPLIPAHYRLSGSNSWDGAQQHILNVAKKMLGQHFDELVKKHLG